MKQNKARVAHHLVGICEEEESQMPGAHVQQHPATKPVSIPKAFRFKVGFAGNLLNQLHQRRKLVPDRFSVDKGAAHSHLVHQLIACSRHRRYVCSLGSANCAWQDELCPFPPAGVD